MRPNKCMEILLPVTYDTRIVIRRVKQDRYFNVAYKINSNLSLYE